MKLFATATKPEPIRNQTVQYASYGLGLWATLLAAMQMVSFEDFVEALRDYKLGNETMTVTVAVLMITLEVFAVPFLLRLELSRAARYVSALFGVLLPFVWTILTLHVFWIGASAPNAGYFGGFFAFPVGGLAVVVDVVWIVVGGLTFGAMGGKRVLTLKV